MRLYEILIDVLLVVGCMLLALALGSLFQDRNVWRNYGDD